MVLDMVSIALIPWAISTHDSAQLAEDLQDLLELGGVQVHARAVEVGQAELVDRVQLLRELGALLVVEDPVEVRDDLFRLAQLVVGALHFARSHRVCRLAQEAARAVVEHHHPLCRGRAEHGVLAVRLG